MRPSRLSSSRPTFELAPSALPAEAADAEPAEMLHVAWFIPACPLLGFALLILFGRRLGDPGAGWLATDRFRPWS